MNEQSQTVLARLGLMDDPRVGDGQRGDGWIPSENPATGAVLACVRAQTRDDYEVAVARAEAVQRSWRMLPAPKRGEIVRRIGNEMRAQQDDLGALVSLECGKIHAEGIGEVVECVDIADFSVGLSRQLYGLTMHSERPQHRMYEQWHPLGTIGVITAFNFPVAVWAWNAMVAAVCGNAMIWKPSPITPLTAIAMNNLARRVMREQDVFRPEGGDPADVFQLVIGRDAEIGEALTHDRRLPLVSATGSCRMGRIVGSVVAQRLGRSLLELGGNNAIIAMDDCDIDLTVRAVLFGAVGTAGQRCTSTRRLLCQAGVVDTLAQRLVDAYQSISIGDPLDASTLMGPLINEAAVASMRAAIERAQAAGCEVLTGGTEGIDRFDGTPGHFVTPTIVRIPAGAPTPDVVLEETFAPILYVFEVKDLDEAMARHNEVDQGLSSAISPTAFGLRSGSCPTRARIAASPT